LALVVLAIGGCGPASIIFGRDSGNLILSSKAFGSGWEYDEALDVYKILDGANVKVSGSAMSSRILVVEGASATLTLKSITIDLREKGGAPINLEDGASVELRLDGVSTLYRIRPLRGRSSTSRDNANDNLLRGK
jgi:hypothetical protein